MAGFVKVAEVADVDAGGMKLVEIEGKQIALANVDGTVYAFGNICTHVGAPLVEGFLDGEDVTCPWHGAVFCVKTGENTGGPGEGPVPTYEVKIDGTDIMVSSG